MMERIAGLLLDAVFPPRCVLCHELLFEERGESLPLCDACRSGFSDLRARGGVVGEHFHVCYSALRYTESFRESFHRYKFYGHWHYSKPYGRWMWEALSEEMEASLQSFDCISWTPLSRRRNLSRGYDQSRRLAEEVAAHSGLPLVPLLRKKKHIAPLSRSADPDQRSKSIHNAYVMRREADVVGKRVLLIDDVITTGSTLEEASRILIENGAAEVCCLTLARAGGSKK